MCAGQLRMAFRLERHGLAIRFAANCTLVAYGMMGSLVLPDRLLGGGAGILGGLDLLLNASVRLNGAFQVSNRLAAHNPHVLGRRTGELAPQSHALYTTLAPHGSISMA